MIIEKRKIERERERERGMKFPITASQTTKERKIGVIA